MQKFKVFSGRSYPLLAEKVCQKLGVPLNLVKNYEYRNGCFEPVLEGDLRNKIVFLFQTSRTDINKLHKDIWEILQMTNSAKSCGAKEIIAVMPYISYARSDKAYEPGMGIGAELLVRLLECSGMTGFIGVDFHSPRFEKFFSSEVYEVSALNLLAEELKKADLKNSFVLPADMGAFKDASVLAKKLGIPVGRVEKERVSDTEVQIKEITGDFTDKDVFIFDDEISTGTTLKTLVEKIEDKIKSVTFVVTHGLFVGKAIENFQSIRKLKEIVFTDTIPVSEEAKRSLPLKILSVDDILAEEMRKI